MIIFQFGDDSPELLFIDYLESVNTHVLKVKIVGGATFNLRLNKLNCNAAGGGKVK